MWEDIIKTHSEMPSFPMWMDQMEKAKKTFETLEWAKKHEPKMYKEYVESYNEWRATELARKSEV